jgi:hypothetical protein
MSLSLPIVRSFFIKIPDLFIELASQLRLAAFSNTSHKNIVKIFF